MSKRWRIVVELTFDQLPSDKKELYAGDSDVDFANRAFTRIRPTLNSITGDDKPFAHYHLVATPTGGPIDEIDD